MTTRLDRMHDHMPKHGRTASQHQNGVAPLWRACLLQTYFTAGGLIDYFVVDGDGQDPPVPSTMCSVSTAVLHKPYAGPRPSSRTQHDIRCSRPTCARKLDHRVAFLSTVCWPGICTGGVKILDFSSMSPHHRVSSSAGVRAQGKATR
jgi:hypothetical protein